MHQWKTFQLFFKKGKEKHHSLQSRGNGSGYTTLGDQWQKLSSSSALYSLHVRAAEALTAGLHHLQARPQESAHLDHLTWWQRGTLRDRCHSDTRSLCSRTVEPRPAQPHGAAERNNATLYWIIWINNLTQAAEKAAFTKDKAWR